jgi:hypothetical protein
MTHTNLCIYTILALGLIIACPVQAFTITTLDFVVENNQDMTVTFNYELDILEQTAVWVNLVDPAAELKAALEANTGKPVDNVIVTDNSVQATIRGFTTQVTVDNTITTTTPGLSFANAEAAVQQYWFAALVSVDYSPAVTRVVYPDQYTETFYEVISIPSTTHTVMYE